MHTQKIHVQLPIRNMNTQFLSVNIMYSYPKENGAFISNIYPAIYFEVHWM